MAAMEAPDLTNTVNDLTQEQVNTYITFYRSERARVYDGHHYLGLMKAYKHLLC